MRDYLKGKKCMVWSFMGNSRMYQALRDYGDRLDTVGIFTFEVSASGTISETGTSISSMMTYINRWPHIRWLLTIMNHGTASIFTALRNNTGGAKDTFLSEIVRIMEKYPWCAGIDIDLERGGGYENRAAANALFRDIYQTVKAYNPAKRVNICLPGMTGVQGSVGGENWCVYADLDAYCDTASIMSYGMAWAGSAPGPVSPRSWLEGIYDYAVRAMTPEKLFMGLPGYGWNWQIYDTPENLGKTYRGTSNTYYAAKLWMTGGYNFTDDKPPQPFIPIVAYWDDYDKVPWALPQVYDYMEGRDAAGFEYPLLSGTYNRRHYLTAYGKEQKAAFGTVYLDRGGGTPDSHSGIVSVSDSMTVLGEGSSATYRFTIAQSGAYDLAVRLCFPFWDKNALRVTVDGQAKSFSESRLWWPYWRRTCWLSFAEGMSLAAGAHTLTISGGVTSYEAQVDYYTRYIQAKDEWEFVEVYTDEGISATNTKKRDGFNRMVADALAGKIDLIITKSISRFARNTVDTLTTVRKLKEKGIEVFFEKENIRTLDGKGELLITIMSSLAQEESRSISENVTWGQRKRFADGKVSIPYGRFLGYQKGANDLPEIVEEEAAIIRLIYRLFLYGKSPSAIASYLTDEGIKTPGGKAIWRSKTVESILSNEKYKGDALLQKKFTVDFLTKKSKVNEGEVPQYYVANSHPAIIEPEVFDLVQYELKRRKKDGRFTSCAYPFSGKIICGECGGIYGSKVWHSNTPNRTLVWQCNEKHRGQNCKTPHLTDAEIQAAFLIAFNSILGKREEIIEAYHEVMEALTDTTDLDTEREQLQNESEVIMGLIRKAIEDNAQKAMDQAEYEKKYTGLCERYEAARQRLSEIEELRLERNAKRAKIDMFLAQLTGCGGLVTEFDEELWYSTVDFVTIYGDMRMVFTFRDGREVIVKKDAWKAA